MDIVKVEHKSDHTLIKLDKGDPTDENWHVIPSGCIEARQEQWGLTREEALDLILVQAHEDPDGEIPDRFTASDLAAATEKLKQVVSAKVQNVKYANGITRKQICDGSKLDPEMELAVREVIREDLEVAARVKPITRQESLERFHSNKRGVGAGFERLAQERLADEIITASPELKHAPRVQGEETVGLTVKFV